MMANLVVLTSRRVNIKQTPVKAISVINNDKATSLSLKRFPESAENTTSANEAPSVHFAKVIC